LPKRPAAEAEERLKRVGPQKAELLRYLDEEVGAAKLLASLPTSHAPEKASLSRTVWMYWHDGWENAPELTKLCLQSWRLRNPDLEIRALDYRTLPAALQNPPVHHEASTLNGFANRVRLRLLREHGGIWVDATLFCTQPAFDWLSPLARDAGLFGFALSQDRIIATWLLAATSPCSPLMAAWEELYSAYFAALEAQGRSVHAYFAMPYALEHAISLRSDLQSLWAALPKRPIGTSNRLLFLANLEAGNRTPLTPKRCEAIKTTLQRAPVHKLTWKGAVREKAPAADQLLDILRENLAGAAWTAEGTAPAAQTYKTRPAC